MRQSPIAGAVLCNADVDHTLGLLLLRELQPLRVHATESIRRILTEDNSMFAMLQRVPGQVTWTDFTPGTTSRCSIPPAKIPACAAARSRSARTIPRMFRRAAKPNLLSSEASLGLIVESPSGKRLAYMPAVPQIDDALLKEFESADVLLVRRHVLERRRTDPHSGLRPDRAADGPRPGFFKPEQVGATAPST